MNAIERRRLLARRKILVFDPAAPADGLALAPLHLWCLVDSVKDEVESHLRVTTYSGLDSSGHCVGAVKTEELFDSFGDWEQPHNAFVSLYNSAFPVVQVDTEWLCET